MNLVVIGGSSGLGMNICKFYLSKYKNVNIICASSDIKELLNVQKDLYSRYRKKIILLKCDLLSKSDINKFSNFVIKKYKKKIDLIFYCSGVNLQNNDLMHSLSSFEDMLKINFIGFHALISSLHKYLNNNNFKSNIIYISSISTIRIRYKNFLYFTSKKIVEYYVKGLNMNLNKVNKNILVVYMGYLNTKLGITINSSLKIDPYLASKIIHKNLFIKKESIYIPSYWYLLRILILIIPKKIWNALKI